MIRKNFKGTHRERQEMVIILGEQQLVIFEGNIDPPGLGKNWNLELGQKNVEWHSSKPHILVNIDKIYKQ